MGNQKKKVIKKVLIFSILSRIRISIKIKRIRSDPVSHDFFPISNLDKNGHILTSEGGKLWSGRTELGVGIVRRVAEILVLRLQHLVRSRQTGQLSILQISHVITSEKYIFPSFTDPPPQCI